MLPIFPSFILFHSLGVINSAFAIRRKQRTLFIIRIYFPYTHCPIQFIQMKITLLLFFPLNIKIHLSWGIFYIVFSLFLSASLLFRCLFSVSFDSQIKYICSIARSFFLPLRIRVNMYTRA